MIAPGRRVLAGLVLFLAGCISIDPPAQEPQRKPFDLIELTGLDHERLFVNPTEVVMIRSPRTHHRILPTNAHCGILTTDGKMVAVLESCQLVYERLGHHAPP